MISTLFAVYIADYLLYYDYVWSLFPPAGTQIWGACL